MNIVFWYMLQKYSEKVHLYTKHRLADVVGALTHQLELLRLHFQSSVKQD